MRMKGQFHHADRPKTKVSGYVANRSQFWKTLGPLAKDQFGELAPAVSGGVLPQFVEEGGGVVAAAFLAKTIESDAHSACEATRRDAGFGGE